MHRLFRTEHGWHNQLKQSHFRWNHCLHVLRAGPRCQIGIGGAVPANYLRGVPGRAVLPRRFGQHRLRNVSRWSVFSQWYHRVHILCQERVRPRCARLLSFAGDYGHNSTPGKRKCSNTVPGLWGRSDSTVSNLLVTGRVNRGLCAILLPSVRTSCMHICVCRGHMGCARRSVRAVPCGYEHRLE